MSHRINTLVFIFMIVIFVFVKISHQNENLGQHRIVQSKAANLIRRILNSEILSPGRPNNLLFQNTLRKPKIKEMHITSKIMQILRVSMPFKTS